MEHSPLTVFVGACAFLYLKMLANSMVQAYCRFRYKSFKYREDEPFFRCKFEDQEPQPELLTRADAAWRNDHENIPIFLAAALCGLLTGVPLPVYTGLVVAFCVGRSTQTLCLLKGIQPWRFIGFVTGQICTSALFIWSLRLLGWS